MLLNTLKSFLKIGAIGFGGGSALIPVIEDEVVAKKKYVDQQRFTEHTIVANITPGALALKLGALCGHDMAGKPGMLTGASAIAIPGVLITVISLAFLSILGDSAIRQIEFASVGISAFIIFLLIEYILKVMKDSNKQDFIYPAIAILIFSTIATTGKEFREMLNLFAGIEGEVSPFIDISTISLLYIAFFLIFFTGGKIKSVRMIFASVISIFALFVFGDGDVLGLAQYSTYLGLFMLALMVVATFNDIKKDGVKHSIKMDYITFLKKLSVFIIFAVVLSIPALLTNPLAFDYIINGIISTATSFGGGEAYISVADGMFVATGMIDPSVYYGQIVPIANALPSPILIKVLAGIGYVIGFESGNMFQGFLMAMSGFSIAITVSCGICLVVDMIYHTFSDLQVFVTLRKWILPFICGLLVSTIFSMFNEQLKVTESVDISLGVSLIFIGVLFAAVVALCNRLRVNSVLVIVLVGMASVIFLNL